MGRYEHPVEGDSRTRQAPMLQSAGTGGASSSGASVYCGSWRQLDDATFEQLLGEVLPPELEAELELYAWRLSLSSFLPIPFRQNLTRLHVCQVWAWEGTSSNFTRHDNVTGACRRFASRTTSKTTWPQRSGETCVRVLHVGTVLGQCRCYSNRCDRQPSHRMPICMHLVLRVVHAKYECVPDFPAVRSRGTYSILMHGEAQY